MPVKKQDKNRQKYIDLIKRYQEILGEMDKIESEVGKLKGKVLQKNDKKKIKQTLEKILNS